MPRKQKSTETAPAKRWAFYLPENFEPLVRSLCELSGRTLAREIAWQLNRAATEAGVTGAAWPTGGKRGPKTGEK